MPIIISIPFYNLNRVFVSYYTGKKDQFKFGLIRILRSLFVFVFIIIAGYISKSQKFLFWSFFLAEFILLAVNIYLNLNILNFKFDITLSKELRSFGFKSYISELFATITDKLDLIILGYFLSNYDCGIYSILIFFIKSLYVFPGIIQQNISPLIAENWRNNKITEFNIKIRPVKKITFWILILKTIFIIIAYFLLIERFNFKMIQDLIYLSIGLLGTFPMAYVSWAGSALIMTNQLTLNFYRTLLLIILAFISTTLFTFAFGLTGAFVAVAFNGIIGYILYVNFIKKYTGLSVF